MKTTGLLIVLMLVLGMVNAQELSPFYNAGNLKGGVDEVGETVTQKLKEKGFEILGSYHPENSKFLKVIAFTRPDLKNVCSQVEDRGMLAAALKVGLKRIADGKTLVTLLNPDYLFHAYLRDDVKKHQAALNKVSRDAKAAVKSLAGKLIPFGGKIDVDDLKDYHYMAFMPYFTDHVEVGEFESFEEGLATIRKNLSARKGETVKVFEIVDNGKKVAVFGVGLLHKDDGEAFFLPIIGEKHLAALPYELILEGKEATILPGRFRFALFWPELSMSEFMKIVQTPGDVEDFMEGLCE